LCTRSIGYGIQPGFILKFINAAFIRSIGVALDEHQSLHADLRTLHPLREFIGLFAAVFTATGYRNGHNGFGFVKYFKVYTIN
jgi:hypothetical protein